VEVINPIAGAVQSLAGLAEKLSDTERELSDKLTALENSVEGRVHRIQQDHTYLKTITYLVLGLLVVIAGRLAWAWVEGIIEPSRNPSQSGTMSAPAPAAHNPSIALPEAIPSAPVSPSAPTPQSVPTPSETPGRGATSKAPPAKGGKPQ
jgi:hypothetical protein